MEDLDGNQVEIWPQSQTSYGQAAGLFGVNCKHYPMAFIPGFSTLRGQPQDPEENEKTYAESQEQRRLERNLREKRLKVEQLKAQGAPEEEIKAAKAKTREASSRVQEFCDSTGRTRRRNREGTPVMASWKGAEKGPFAYGTGNNSLKTERGNVKLFSKLDANGNVTAPMNEERFRRMRSNLERHGLEVVQAQGDDLRYLIHRGAEASYWDGRITYIGEVPSASAMFEETIHATQARIYGELLETNQVELAAREIAAQEKLLKNGKAYGFSPDDFSDIQTNRNTWANYFKSLTGEEYDPDDKTSKFYRGV